MRTNKIDSLIPTTWIRHPLPDPCKGSGRRGVGAGVWGVVVV
jgi:hypothetical protein